LLFFALILDFSPDLGAAQEQCVAQTLTSIAAMAPAAMRGLEQAEGGQGMARTL